MEIAQKESTFKLTKEPNFTPKSSQDIDLIFEKVLEPPKVVANEVVPPVVVPTKRVLEFDRLVASDPKPKYTTTEKDVVLTQEELAEIKKTSQEKLPSPFIVELIPYLQKLATKLQDSYYGLYKRYDEGEDVDPLTDLDLTPMLVNPKDVDSYSSGPEFSRGPMLVLYSVTLRNPNDLGTKVEKNFKINGTTATTTHGQIIRDDDLAAFKSVRMGANEFYAKAFWPNGEDIITEETQVRKPDPSGDGSVYLEKTHTGKKYQYKDGQIIRVS